MFIIVAAQNIAPKVLRGTLAKAEILSPYINNAEIVTIKGAISASIKSEGSIFTFNMEMKISAGVPV